MNPEISFDETMHLQRVAAMQAADDATTHVPESRTLTGHQALDQELAAVQTLLLQLRAKSGLQPHVVEATTAKVQALRAKAEATEEHSAQFLLAVEVRQFGQAMEGLLVE